MEMKVTTKTNDIRDEKIGCQIIELLDLNLKDNGRVDTSWGDKTPAGLTRTLRRFLHDEADDYKSSVRIGTSSAKTLVNLINSTEQYVVMARRELAAIIEEIGEEW